ncbi:MAG: tRNA U34 5-methylaminomethyl-2-thiouridine-forming methyltransferase MnmC [Cyclobacteriaceae bacterium]
MRDISVKVIQTEDGSTSLLREDMNETYHSFRGALGESKKVFIECGLSSFHDEHPGLESISVLEVGLGTGLNMWLTANYATFHQQPITATSLEPFPIPQEVIGQLRFGQDLPGQTVLNEIHACPWGSAVQIHAFFSLEKRQEKFEDYKTSKKFDLIYFDAFAPSKQPEVWSTDNLATCYGLLNKGGILTTYCAQGQFKRDLASVGFDVQTLPGAMGKKEMVRGIRRT